MPQWCEVMTGHPVIEESHMVVPEAPGLGVDIDEEAIAQYPSGATCRCRRRPTTTGTSTRATGACGGSAARIRRRRPTGRGIFYRGVVTLRSQITVHIKIVDATSGEIPDAAEAQLAVDMLSFRIVATDAAPQHETPSFEASH